MGTKFKLKLRDKKDHFVATVYKDTRTKLDITPSSLILFEINNCRLIREPNKDFHITLPKKIVKNDKEEVEINILKIYDKNKAKQRESLPFKNNYVNFKHFIPEKTIFGNQIYLLEESPNLYVWYSVGGGVKPIKIKTKFNAILLAELTGFYFGDGNTSQEIRSFRLNNCEPSILNHSLNILHELGIERNKIKVQIIYSSDKEIDSEIKRRCINYWHQILKIKKAQITSVNRSKNKRESLRYGSARIYVDNSALVEVMLHGLLKKFVKIVENPKSDLEFKITEGFLRGLLAAEGSVILEKDSLRKVGISFNPYSNDAEFYKKILENLNISWKFIHGNELMIHKFENFKKLFELNAFALHRKRNEKFLLGFKNHRYYKTLSPE